MGETCVSRHVASCAIHVLMALPGIQLGCPGEERFCFLMSHWKNTEDSHKIIKRSQR